MPLERKKDLRVEKTQHAIKETFKQMVLEMDASEITIKELTASSLVLTLDALKMADIPAEAKKALENYSVLLVISLTK